MTLQRAVVLLVVLALMLGSVGVAALSLFGGGGGDGADPRPADMPRTTPAPDATVPPSPELARFYEQELDWEPCRGVGLCTTLEVPLDYRDPGGASLELAVLGVPAGDPAARIGSLVVNPGGPGAPGTDYAASAAMAFRQPIRDAYDIVGFDPRGTGGSDPVDCLSDDELDEYVAQDPDPDTAAEAATYSDWVERLGAGCAERSGPLAAHVSTVEAARDMDVLRAALGESSMTYFGASYGTKLGATYADLFPDRAGRMVLDGAVDLSLDARELALQQAEGFETALRAYVGSCVDDGDCFLGDTVDEALARIRALLDDIDAAPLPADSGRDLRVGNAFYGIVLPLYSRDFWGLLSDALGEALDGDGTQLLMLADLYVSREASGYRDNSAEAIYAISCLDDPWAIPAREVPGQLADFEAASPTFGSVFAWGLTGCGGMQVEPADPPREVRAAGADPIVVVGTTRDPATPYRWAERLADQLESGVLVSRDGDGHTGYNSGNECVDDAVEGYLVDGEVPADGLEC